MSDDIDPKEKKRLYMAEWRAKNAEHKKDYAKRYYADNRDARLQYTKEYIARNKDSVAQKKAAHRAKPEVKERERLNNAKRRAANPEKEKASTRAYRQKNVARILARNQNRRAKLNSGKLSLDIIAKLQSKQKGKCACCKTSLKKSGHHLDHIEPLANGGANEDRNMQLLCPFCNLSKGAQDPLEFMRKRGFLV